GVHVFDLFDEFGVPHRTSRRGTVLGGVVGARGDLHTRIGQDAADRLDPELLALNEAVAVGIDELDDHRDRHRTGSSPVDYLILRSSSAAAKKAALVFKISFARRSSRTSRSNCAIRSLSSLVVPGTDTAVDLGLLHPRPQRLRMHTELIRDPLHRTHPRRRIPPR